MTSEYFKGQRLSFDGALCTVRYIGEVEGTKSDWLGVEWDDPIRGKHSGEHKGKIYFTCKSKQPTAGSFVRPSRPVDPPRGFLEALHQKYASEFEEERERQKDSHVVQPNESIQFNGKVVEEVGFEKIRKQLAELQDLRIVLVDGLRVAGILSDNRDAAARRQELEKIEQTCPKIAELDLSRNLLYRWQDVQDICKQLKQLRSLKLNGNRLEDFQPGFTFNQISELHLDQTLMPWDQIASLAGRITFLNSLTASTNQISTISSPLPSSIRNLTLEHNEIVSLSSLKLLSALPNLERLSLRGNNIRLVDSTEPDLSPKAPPFQFSRTLKFLDISHNQIDGWLLINALTGLFPGLDSLRISNNPLYDQAVAPANVTGFLERPMTVDEAFMLTLARLRNLSTLNYSKISPQDRTNAELYYLSLIGKELSANTRTEEDRILKSHPRFAELCEIYGDPAVKRESESNSQGVAVNPRSVAARLVNFRFYLSSSTFSMDLGEDKSPEKVYEIPRSFDVYRIKAIVSRIFALPSLKFKLVWETDEWDPVEEFNVGGEEWDSDDEQDEEDETPHKSETQAATSVVTKADGSKFIKREVELADSTRDVGFWFDDNLHEARVRIEILP